MLRWKKVKHVIIKEKIGIAGATKKKEKERWFE
jgi:hypothetical protein